jgi:hypothetical protein
MESGRCGRIRLRLAAGSSGGSAANQSSLRGMIKKERVLWSQTSKEYLVCFCIAHLPALKSLPSSSLQMQLHPMISTEVQSHTNPVENPLLAQLSLVESQLLAL